MKYLVLFFLSILSNLFATSRVPLKNSNQYIKEIPANFYGTLRNIDSVIIIYYRDFVYNAVGLERLNIKPDSNGGFSVHTLPLSGIGKIRQIQVYFGDDHRIFSNYIIEPGDNIRMDFYNENNKVIGRFAGEGGEKYICRNKIDSLTDVFRQHNEQVSVEFADQYTIENIDKLTAPHRTSRSAMMAVLQEYRSQINSKIFSVMEADIVATTGLSNLLTVTGFYLSDDYKIADSAKVRDAFVQYCPKENIFSGDVSTWSWDYVDYALRHEVYTFIYDHKDKIPVTIDSIFNRIVAKYNGILRERLLMNWIAFPGWYAGTRLKQRDNSLFETAKSAIDIIETPAIRRQVSNVFAIQKNAEAYNFNLPTLDGKLISLQDLKGKVVLMDLWGTGCTACIRFTTKFKDSIESTLKNDQTFAYVSINIDNTEAQWKKSIASGLYSSSDFINLFAGSGENNSISKYYDVFYIPYLLLIDKKGKVFERIDPSMNSSEIKLLIDAAIQE